MSLLDHFSLDPISIINDFKMSINHPSYEKITLYLEGKTDIMLFRGIVDENKIELVPVNGKKNIIEVMRSLYNIYLGKVYAVCDADFDHIFQKKDERLDHGIFITDYHDIEVMMVWSSAIHKVLDQKSKNNSNNFYDKVLEEVIQVCKTVGFLRLVNYDKDLKLKFKRLNFNKFILFDNGSLSLDFDILLNELIRISPSTKVTIVELKSYHSQYTTRNYDNKQMCCGHDCTNVLAIYFNKSKNIEGNNFNKDRVEKDLMLAFNEYDKYAVFDKVRRIA
ncbi:DUF4435 domain-containing protein [Psychrobacter sp. 72-O-c]|uniref:DUF4435 domain-containing protein n=1 Tax=Psychrobacter sp. 72-O-c TaxID=2774125 RepID=UPI001918A612|nr:DUF4435 domain-containing protein [Psychrobacter sp. 72-O-c]